jgi:hypothetical protein
MKKILIINGHPNKESFNYGLSEAYKKGAEKSGNEVKEILVGELEFGPNLQYGYQKRTELEPDFLFSTLGHPFQIRLKAWNNSTCSSLVSNTLSYDSTGLISILIFWIDLAISIAFSGLNPSFFSFNCLSSSL